jgi:Ni,Fe-hydrogenase III large subunit/Ni,Fe-hydrogenase III component G
MNNEMLKQYIYQDTKVESFGSTRFFEVSVSKLKEIVVALHGQGLSLKFMTATDDRKEHGDFRIWYIFYDHTDASFVVPFIRLKNGEKFPTITPIIHGAWNYEKRIATFFGLIAEGHPDPRPLILHENWPSDIYPLRKDFAWNERPAIAKGTYKFQEVGGEGIYEIPVGPIHAGIIEPGHFRFSVAGEEIVLLEPHLGFTHKGSEKLFEKLSQADMVSLSEKISGDSSFSHSLAFCQAMEQLSETVVPKRAKYLRVIYAELERLANHFGDIGAIMTDTGFNFGGAQGARLREIIMQLNDKITGSRFLRGVNVIGGVTKDIPVKVGTELAASLKDITKDFFEVMAIVETSDTLVNRLEGTGRLTEDIVASHGATGIAAKAAGINRDSRIDFPYAAYKELGFKEIATEINGDVEARFRIRLKEITSSISLIENALDNIPSGPLKAEIIGPLKPDVATISVVEGWRGEIIYFLSTDSQGNIQRVDPRDPSRVNWLLLEHAGFGNIVPDFPLINKSFNLSYTGNDL